MLKHQLTDRRVQNGLSLRVIICERDCDVEALLVVKDEAVVEKVLLDGLDDFVLLPVHQDVDFLACVDEDDEQDEDAADVASARWQRH